MSVLPTIRLTDHQKKVMTTIVASETPVVAGERISGNVNIVAARDILVDLGLITYDENKGATITDSGKQVMIDHALIDENGELTEDGLKYAYDGEKVQQESVSYKEKFKMIKHLSRF